MTDMDHEMTSIPSNQTNQIGLESIWDSHIQQAVFRSLMDAMSRPGKVIELKDVLNGDTVHRAVLATLVGGEVSLCDYHDLLQQDDWPLLQASQTHADAADYILCDGSQEAEIQPKLGTLSSPDFAATLIMLVDTIGEGEHQLKLQGPGVNGVVNTRLKGFHNSWYEKRDSWNSAFPLGVDMIIVDTKRVMALPRTTQVEVIK